jgi:preprotein translocase subunit SecG
LFRDVSEWITQQRPAYLSYHFLFRLAKRTRRVWHLNSHSRKQRHSSDGDQELVCLLPAKGFVCEYWFLTTLFAVIPVILVVLHSQDTVFGKADNSVLTKLPFFYIMAAGFLPVVIYRIVSFLFPRHDFMHNVWKTIPAAYRSWVDNILNQGEHLSPIAWAGKSADEVLLRYAMMDYFLLFGPQNSVWLSKIYRLGRAFFSPIYISYFSIQLQIVVCALLLPMGDEQSSTLLVRVYSISIALWLVVAILYSVIQLRRVDEQVFADESLRNQELLPLTLPPAYLHARLNVRSKLVSFGLPGTYIGLAGLTLPFMQLMFSTSG